MILEKHLQSILLELALAERAVGAGQTAPKATAEQEELARLEQELKRMREAAGSAQLAVDDMEAEILRIQEDERKLKRRERDDREQLSATTDLELRKDLERDRYNTKSRINDLLNELKEAHNEIHALRNNRDVHGARVDELARQVEVARRAAQAANEAQPAEDPQEKISALRAQLPAEVVAAYDERKKEADAGAAMFNGRSCVGCFIALPSADRSVINRAPENEVPECPNCGTYLVRKTS